MDGTRICCPTTSALGLARQLAVTKIVVVLLVREARLDSVSPDTMTYRGQSLRGVQATVGAEITPTVGWLVCVASGRDVAALASVTKSVGCTAMAVGLAGTAP